MPVIEFEGKNTEEAIEKACNQLHIAPDELKFEILTTGSSGIFGLGGKKAKIRVKIEEKITPKKTEPQKADVKEEPIKITIRPRKDLEPVKENRKVDFGRKTERKRSDSKRIELKEKSEKSTPEREEKTRKPFPKETARGPKPLPPTVPSQDEKLYDGPDDDVMTSGKDALQGLLNHMGLESEVKVKRIADRIILSIEGENSGLLIGKKGATLDALQFLINKIVNRNKTEKVRVIVDTENYRERRHQSLIELADRMAEKAKRNRRPVTISQLSAHDRRVVHLTLQEVNGIRTRSRGDGPLKNIVIIPGVKKSGGRPARGGNSNKEEFLEKFNDDFEDDLE